MWCTRDNASVETVDALRNSVTNSKTKRDQGSLFSFRPRLTLASDTVVYAQQFHTAGLALRNLCLRLLYCGNYDDTGTSNCSSSGSVDHRLSFA